MNLDDTIRAMAALGQSKGQVREALGIPRNKFTEIAKMLPDIHWQQTPEERAARIAGAKKGIATRRAKHLRTVNGVTGSIEELCERFGQCSAGHARRRIRQGMSPAEAITTPAPGRWKKAA
ncbi:hypothetical protein MCB86_09055 [Pseudomonas sp. KSR10]|uniref:hypothetical protein n=1 Tax=Pseudomonas sp. KSR10 TaxID=2916654 RepID=UPI001EF96DEB|nr:hypothetical protein [Pseudomonas sp. KSR10]MCG6540222.1 hypothetical protein [Pseudomonas sp. KSR10]